MKRTTDIVVSFCITCKGRLHHLRRTLPANLRDNEMFPGVEFVLLNYSSPDGLDRWVATRMARHLKSGRLVYYKLSGRRYFHATHAKNVAHRLARGRIVCNLDADNFTGADFARFLARTFARRKNIFVRPVHTWGASGRVALLKKHFAALGGYNERIRRGWGFDDDDLALRAQAAGLRHVKIPPGSPFVRLIKHTDAERQRYMGTPVHAKVSRLKNLQLSCRRIEKARLVVHPDGQWGRARVKRMFAPTEIVPD
jgi:hypothetical protein